MLKHLRLNEVFPDWLSGDGIFHYIQNNTSIPWSDPDISGILDTAYHGDHGDRLISPLVRKLLDTDNELTTANKQKLANVITTLFLPQWQHTYELLTLQYDPLNNYDMTETETYEGSNENEHRDTGTLGNSGTVGRSGTIGNAGTVAHTGTSTDETENTAEGSLYGFNSASAVDSDKSTSEGGNTHTNNLTDTTNMTETHNLTDTTNMTETHNLTGSDAGSNTYERTLTRSGNIGVTTSQQMAQSQIDLWKWNFYRSVFKDIDSVLTLRIY